MKLPLIYRLLLRFILASLVILLTFSWAINNPRKIDQLRGIVSPNSYSNSKQRVLEVVSFFTMCRHSEIKRYRFSNEKLFNDQLLKHPEYRPAKNEQGHAIYQTVIKTFCSSCRNNHFIGLQQQQVVVYRGTPIQPGPIEERLALQIQLLPQAEINDLKKGIPFADPREKLQLIEGLNGLIME